MRFNSLALIAIRPPLGRLTDHRDIALSGLEEYLPRSFRSKARGCERTLITQEKLDRDHHLARIHLLLGDLVQHFLKGAEAIRGRLLGDEAKKRPTLIVWRGPSFQWI